MVCDYKGFTLNLAHLWFPFVMSSMRKVELVPRVFTVLIASSSCDLLCPPWHFIKNRSTAVGGFPAAPRVWMKSSGNTDVVRDSLISCHLLTLRNGTMMFRCRLTVNSDCFKSKLFTVSQVKQDGSFRHFVYSDFFVYLWPDRYWASRTKWGLTWDQNLKEIRVRTGCLSSSHPKPLRIHCRLSAAGRLCAALKNLLSSICGWSQNQVPWNVVSPNGKFPRELEAMEKEVKVI